MHAHTRDLFVAVHAAVEALRSAGAPVAEPSERSAAAALTAASGPFARPAAPGGASAQGAFGVVETEDLARIAANAAADAVAARGWRPQRLGSADAAATLAASHAARRARDRPPLALISAGPSGRGPAPERAWLSAVLDADGAPDGASAIALSTDGRDHSADAAPAEWIAGAVSTPDRRRRRAALPFEARRSPADLADALGDALRLGALDAPRLGLRIVLLSP